MEDFLDIVSRILSEGSCFLFIENKHIKFGIVENIIMLDTNNKRLIATVWIPEEPTITTRDFETKNWEPNKSVLISDVTLRKIILDNINKFLHKK